MESGNLRRALKAKSHLSVENANLRAEIERLRAALRDCLDDMEQLRASGDAGSWDWQDGDVYSRGRAALDG